jgi:hypothetical protein
VKITESATVELETQKGTNQETPKGVGEPGSAKTRENFLLRIQGGFVTLQIFHFDQIFTRDPKG